MPRSCQCFALLAVMFVMVPAGCSPPTRQAVKTVKVSGTVTLAGKPFGEVEVNFLGKEYAGKATTDASGNYKLDAQPGDNQIYFSKFDKPVDPTMGPGDAAQGPGGAKQLVPKKYASPVDSKLTQSVGDADQTGVNFDIK